MQKDLKENSNPLNAEAKTSSSRYYAALTGVRALAAFMVFFVHYNPIDSSAPTGSLTSFFYNIVCHFHIGVSIFFVLSGFLITSRYQQSLQLSWSWARRYVRNRFARIYPLYFIITVITAAISQLYVGYDPSHLWKFYAAKDKLLVLFLNLTLLRGFFDRFLLTIVGQGWSLTVEECFYLSAPLLIIGLRGRPWRLAAYPLMLLGIGIGLVLVCAPFHERIYGLFGSMKFMLNWTFFGRCLEFLLGMALALFMARRPALSESPRRGWATVTGLLWMLACLCALAFFEKGVPSADMGRDLTSPAAILTRNAILPIGVVALFWGLIREHSWLRSLLETKLFDLLGKSSYAFYLVHGGILNFALNDFVTTNIFLKFLITNIVAIVLYKAIEHPVHKMLTRK
jgi:peptidoglycan/LPS O-acetylase OafA/YrhL